MDIKAFNLTLELSKELIKKQAPILMPEKCELPITVTEDKVIVQIPKIETYHQVIFKKAK